MSSNEETRNAALREAMECCEEEIKYCKSISDKRGQETGEACLQGIEGLMKKKKMSDQLSIEIAARIWQDQEMSHRAMHRDLALRIARLILEEYEE